jgi:hypothetical protein
MDFFQIIIILIILFFLSGSMSLRTRSLQSFQNTAIMAQPAFLFLFLYFHTVTHFVGVLIHLVERSAHVFAAGVKRTRV